MPTPFPVNVLPTLLRAYVCEVAESIGCDTSFVALPALSTVAAAIGNSRCVQVRSGWHEPCIVWTALIAEPGCSKTPAIRSAINSLVELQECATPHRFEARSLPQAEPSALKSTTPNAPRFENIRIPAKAQMVTSDTSVPKLVKLLQANPRGLLLVRDELAGWVENVEKRLGGDHWLSIHSGCSITVDRANGGSALVRRAAVSITGGFQPAVLQRCLLANRHRENGMAARFLYSWPAKRMPVWSDSTVQPELISRYSQVLSRLLDLTPLTSPQDPFEPVIVCLSPEAKERFRGFFDESAREQSLVSSDLAATWPKLRAYAARLALVIALVRWAQLDDAAPPETIDLESMEAGIELAEWFGEQARIVFTSTDSEPNARQLSRVLRIIRNRGGSLTANELCRYDRAICSTADAELILNRLACGGYGFWEMLRPSAGGGRPTRRFVLAVDETS